MLHFICRLITKEPNRRLFTLQGLQDRLHKAYGLFYLNSCENVCPEDRQCIRICILYIYIYIYTYTYLHTYTLQECACNQHRSTLKPQPFDFLWPPRTIQLHHIAPCSADLNCACTSGLSLLKGLNKFSRVFEKLLVDFMKELRNITRYYSAQIYAGV